MIYFKYQPGINCIKLCIYLVEINEVKDHLDLFLYEI